MAPLTVTCKTLCKTSIVHTKGSSSCRHTERSSSTGQPTLVQVKQTGNGKCSNAIYYHPAGPVLFTVLIVIAVPRQQRDERKKEQYRIPQLRATKTAQSTTNTTPSGKSGTNKLFPCPDTKKYIIQIRRMDTPAAARQTEQQRKSQNWK